MLRLDPSFTPLLLEAVEDLLFKVSVRLQELKGHPMTAERRELAAKQERLEKLQRELLSSSATAADPDLQ